VPGIRATLSSLRQGEIVAVACDRNIRGDGLRVSFMGKETTLPAGAVKLALQTGAALVPCFDTREANEHHTVHIEPVLDLIASENAEGLIENMKRLVGSMEKYIRSHPEQWVMFQPLWDGE
jgi:KDO2-lipid IV(A) lauroyltransferase